MFLIIVTVIFVLGNVSTNDSEPDPGLNLEACDIGDVVENECSKCICTARHVFDCTSKGCPKRNNDSDASQANIKSQSCHPHKIYNLYGTICICNPDGSWPHDSCHSIFRSLPTANIIKQKCIPDSYVVIDCNVCRCSVKGQIDNDHCTKNECDDPTKGSGLRRNSKNGQVYGKCKTKNWYSFAPCQFCYCLNDNKLKCNTGVERRDAVKLGSYNFSVCGTELLKEALDLARDGKEDENALRLGQDLTSPVTTKGETTTKVADKYDFNAINLDMGGKHSVNNDKDDDEDDNKVKTEMIKVKAAKTQIENTESQEFSDSDYGSDKEQEKFTHQPYEESGNKERDTDNGGGRTEDRDDKDKNNSEEGSVENIPIKPTEKEQSEDSAKASEEEKSRGRLSIKFDINKADKLLTNERVPPSKIKSLKEKKSSRLDGKKDTKESVEFDIGKVIKNGLPLMFGKVLDNLRKTVSLDSENDCEPGTRIVVKCNICHCLKNKKMICTNNKCK